MGTRSDVGVALKKSLVDKLTDAQKESWFSDADRKLEHEEGTLWVWKYVKWYADEYTSIKTMYAWLKNYDSSDYRIVEACFDYPEDETSDLGGWLDNPWCLQRCVTVTLEYNGSDEE
jgi:hypothetical protein